MKMLNWPKPSVLSANPPLTSDPLTDDFRLERRLFMVLGATALIYAFLAGLATVADPDLGWQLATGRWIAQHHHIFSTDVFSYTKAGEPWIYPVGSGLIFYWIYVLGGFSLTSWMGAVACLATVALLLRRGSVFCAAIAILAVPFIAFRAVPRAELFTVVLFAAYVSLLWQNYQTLRAPLWLLPILMEFWVNVHLGFFSGLGLLAAFAGMDILDLPFSDQRSEALQRLKREIPWFLATAVATLVNPWGWRFYPALVQHLGVLHTATINEWAGLEWNWTNSVSSLWLRNTSAVFHVLVAIMVLAIVVALLERQLGTAILLLAAVFEAFRHVRMVAQAGCLAAVVGGSVLYSALPWIRAHLPNRRLRAIIASAATALFAAVAVTRSADLITNYHYLVERNLGTFGAGLSGWFPRGAAEFVANENLPGELLNTFNEGGYLIWKLGPQRRDYIDGRIIPFGPVFSAHGGELLATSLDSALWREEADRYGINTILFPLTLDEISLDRLKPDCASREWRPVYLDEVSVVLVRRRPETEDLIRRLEINCSTAPVPHEQLPLNAAAFNQWIDAARVLSSLGRNSEALSAADNALKIFPDNAHARWYRGQILYTMDRTSQAEEEWRQALALAPREVTPWASLPHFRAAVWSSLAELYHREERIPEAMHALQLVIDLSPDPSTKVQAMANLAALEFTIGQSSAAEKEWLAALVLAPKESSIWFSLADLYQRDRRLPEAIHATQQSVALSSDPSMKARGLVKLARLYLMNRQPQQASQALDDAARAAPPELLAASAGRSFSFDIAQGRAAAWSALGNVEQAISYQEQAVQLDPDAADAWARLAKLYQRQGRVADQQRAEERSKTILAYQRKF
jgi:tetratricopeptide (TPR) repeat protein